MEAAPVPRLGMHSPLSAVVRSPVCVASDTPLREALRTMVEERIGSIVIVDAPSGDRRPIGIFTLRDLLVRVASTACDIDRKIAEVMSGGELVTLGPRATVYQASLSMARHGVRHVIVVDADGRFTGIVSQNDIYRLLRGSDHGSAIGDAIRQAQDMTALTAIAAQIRQQTRQMLVDGLGAEALTQEISTLNDLLTSRVIELTVAESGLPQVEWCWLSFGSEGRFEQTFSTDQDNGLIFETPGGSTPDAAETRRLREIFLPFAARVNQRLADCGFTLCKGNIMAGNPEWCLSLAEWKDRFFAWLQAAEPQALLNATIFFDLRPLFGHERLADALRDWLYSRSPGATMFLRFMAENAVKAAPPLGLVRGFSFARNERFPHTLDLKGAGTRPFVDAARILALAHGIAQTGTAQRLRVLAERGVFSGDEVAALLDGFHYILLLRLRHQQAQGSDVDAEGANRIDPDALNELGRHVLREAFRQAKRLQQRLALEYRL